MNLKSRIASLEQKSQKTNPRLILTSEYDSPEVKATQDADIQQARASGEWIRVISFVDAEPDETADDELVFFCDRAA